MVSPRLTTLCSLETFLWDKPCGSQGHHLPAAGYAPLRIPRISVGWILAGRHAVPPPEGGGVLQLARRVGLRLCSRVPDSEVILETRGLSKEFRGFIAVKRVDLRVIRGTIHALIGPNGAGKTTCFNLLTRFLPATSGTITYKG